MKSIKSKERFGRSDLTAVLVHVEGLSRAQSQRCVQLVLDGIILALIEGKQVQLPNLGWLQATYTAERKGVHPRDLTPMTVKPSVRVRFKQSAPLTAALCKDLERFRVLKEGKAEADTDLEPEAGSSVNNLTETVSHAL